jgi:hypothetical protein
MPLKGSGRKPLSHRFRKGLLEESRQAASGSAWLLARKTILEILDRVRSGEIGGKLVEIQCSRWDIINAGIRGSIFCKPDRQGRWNMRYLADPARTYRTECE